MYVHAIACSCAVDYKCLFCVVSVILCSAYVNVYTCIIHVYIYMSRGIYIYTRYGIKHVHEYWQTIRNGHEIMVCS